MEPLLAFLIPFVYVVGILFGIGIERSLGEKRCDDCDD